MKGLIATVDPGLSGTGVAVFNDTQLKPVNTAVFTSKSKVGSEWVSRQTEVVNKLGMWFVDEYFNQAKWDIQQVYIELPTMFLSGKGLTCATGKDGQDSDLVKLAVLVGRIHNALEDYLIKVDYIPVNEWKGQLTKPIVINRICDRLKCPIDTYPDHIADAVGLGLYVKGVFSANTGTSSSRKGTANQK